MATLICLMIETAKSATCYSSKSQIDGETYLNPHQTALIVLLHLSARTCNGKNQNRQTDISPDSGT
jgi:hypothetical protein